MKRTSSEQLK